MSDYEPLTERDYRQMALENEKKARTLRKRAESLLATAARHEKYAKDYRGMAERKHKESA